MIDYGISVWGQEDFIIEDGVVKINTASKPSVLEIVHQIRKDGHRGPLLLRFPHLIEKQIRTIYTEFNRAIKEFDYQGSFHAVYPLKVNQFPNLVQSLVEVGQEYNYGLEAGSKAELIIAMAYNNEQAPITVNGFKDKEMISLGFIAAKMGHDITITIEGLNELYTIVEVAEEMGAPYPNIGLRMRLHSSGSGVWAKSGGINAKFGLTSTELLEAIDILKDANLLDCFNMIHFHIGSQMGDITPMKRALREVANIYAELRKMGADNLNAINLGGGIAIEYSQQSKRPDRNYTLEEFANDVIFLMKGIAAAKGVKEPDIFTESGRFVAASHAVLIAPVIELFSEEYTEKALRLKESNPPLINELLELYNTIDPKNAIEYLHDSVDHLESLLTLFDLGYIDLEDRSNTEILFHLIIKKVVTMPGINTKDLRNIQENLQERYLINCSIFQSLPDYWGLGQNFPVMPLHHLDSRPTRSASLWDITCDSDGEIAFNPKNPLYLHDIDLEEEEYFLAFFLVGAYQEVLGMQHNLFTHPTEATITFNDDGTYEIDRILQAQNLLDILDDLDYDIKEINILLKQNIEDSPYVPDDTKMEILGQLYLYLSENGYLKTVKY